MKRLLILVNIFLGAIVYSQKIGIVYNINPQMGYTALKGAFKAKAIAEQELDFHLIDFLSDYFKSSGIDFEVRYDFEFSKLEYMNNDFSQKKYVEYTNQYCEQNSLDKIIIVRRNNHYKVTDPVGMYHGLEYDFGVSMLTLYKKRAMFYYNFLLISHNRGEHSFSRRLRPHYLTHKFDNVFSDDNYLLKDFSVVEYYLPIFKGKIKQELDNFLSNN